MDNLIGKRLDGRYQIESLVGMGGMAIRTLQFGIIPALRSFSGSTEESYGDKELSAKGTGE